ncbi:unnamed protein product (macronuclear) [Paramecium tetraurelia]|uniref:Uncharacterized protein n=1 Tax=Paramecium tetraurelia TaxID=5888 RepID=A0C0I9_PARTE|nr:uncharacterized protein GSPATT00006159001 [Paramecium tetraurelia]CAK64306.1 unnamed protein product [Paramecium tetraurelia]|eukprot:XP_001431704.1 hypothetical protein (macronuclear) [Paramecium tetraurelia strain d4-2]
MFFKGKKELNVDNFNPGVGLYDIITKLDKPVAIIHTDKYGAHKKNESLPLSESQLSNDRKVDLNYPLHSYASGIQRVRQNKIYQELKKQVKFEYKPNQFNQEFDTQVRSTIKKGKLVKLQRLQRNSQSSLNDQSLFLGTQSPGIKKTTSQQYLKHPPKLQSLESLELFLLRDKLQKVQDVPGPGSYELPSVFKQTEIKNQPFGKQQGRTKYIDQEASVGVGQYNIQDQSVVKSVIRFDKYSKRISIFENKLNSPTYYDNNSNLISNQSKLNLEFPIAFGSTSKR